MFRIGGWNQSLKSKPKHLKPNISKQHMRVTQAQRRSPKNLGLESKWLDVLRTSEIRSMISMISMISMASTLPGLKSCQIPRTGTKYCDLRDLKGPSYEDGFRVFLHWLLHLVVHMLDQIFLHSRLQGFLGDLLVAAGCRICGLIIRVIDVHSAIVIIVIFACVGHVGLLLLCCLLSHLLLSWCSWNLSCQLRRSFGPMQGFGPAGPFMGMFHYFKCFRCQRDLHSISSKFGVRNLKHQANSVCCDNHGFTHGSCPECAFWLVLDWTHLKNQKWDNRGRTTGAIWERRKRGARVARHELASSSNREHQALSSGIGLDLGPLVFILKTLLACASRGQEFYL